MSAAKEKGMRNVILRAAAIAILALTFAPSKAHAAVTGNIEGVVTDQATGRKLAGVTVTVTSPALQGEQTEFTDAGGHYILTELPPGEYLVRFYFSTITLERPGVVLQADKTLSVNVSMPTQKAEVKTYRITEKAPTVDVGNTQQQTQITSEFVRNTPVQGRTFADIQALAPGAAAGTGEGTLGKSASVSFSGSTGTENNYLIDGVNTTNPAFGLAGTQLTLEFIGETEIITGGYNAEYGRATGGVVSVITKQGSNNFHGDLWFYATPFQLDSPLIARSGEAIALHTKLKYAFDFGFDIGGPIIKDKVWFYAGFAPSFTTTNFTRSLRSRTDAEIPGMPTGNYLGDQTPTTNCPSYLDPNFCRIAGFNTVDLDSKYTKIYSQNKRLYNWIVKFNFQLNANNSLMLQYIGSPATTDGVTQGATSALFNANDGVIRSNTFDNTHDALLHYVSKLLDRRLQLDAIVGYHYEDNNLTPWSNGNGPAVLYSTTRSLGIFENVPECNTRMVNGVNFNPCPVLNYFDGGFGQFSHKTNQRITASVAATYFARLGGTHALKLGFDFEDNIYTDKRGYSGGEVIRVRGTDPAFSPQIYREYGTKNQANGPDGEGNALPQGFSATTKTLNYGAYLRDSYNVGFIPGLTINAGVRWEGQQVQDVTGATQIGIYDNWAPRVGAIYDFTRKGRSKIFASYGWFYESIPLDINDRQFGGEGLISGIALNCPGRTSLGAVDPTSCNHPTITNSQINGGSFGLVSPSLKGQYSEEVVAGIQYDVGLDLVLGASYIHRDLGRIIEDASPDGGVNYLVMNPGAPIDNGAVKDLENKIKSLGADPTSCNGQPGPGCPRATAQQQLALYKNSTQGFVKPVRNYDALVLTATKRLSHNFLVLASYTYSRTLGNYPGTFQASNGQLDPNISTQYDLRELLANRSGPLPNDRPHNLKIQGSYFIPWRDNTFIIGLAFNAYSGSPIEVLGGHPLYGRRETYILPRGSGGRTPFVTQFDFHVSYRRQLSRIFGLEAYWDIFNLFNQTAVTAVDQEYTTSSVGPIADGSPTDLTNLKTTTGGTPVLNPNYGRATAFQAPLSMRFGVRLSF